jgi:hypothetical protein
MKFIKLTYTDEREVIEYIVNCDKIHFISKYKVLTWVHVGDSESEFKVDQTPEEILELINGGNK